MQNHISTICLYQFILKLKTYLYYLSIYKKPVYTEVKNQLLHELK